MMSDPNAIPWLRLSAETGAIVVSILLAFSIDAWWDARQDQAEEREILVGLDAEFIDLRSRLDTWANFNRQGVQLIDQYLSGPVSEMDPESVDLMFKYAFLVNVLDQGGALDALLASGRLERISDRDIRMRLAKWPDWLEDIHTNDLSVREFAWSNIIPFLATHGIPQHHCPDGGWICTPPGPVPPEYLALADDPEFRALLIVRHVTMGFAAVDHENARAEADEILSLIRFGLEELGADAGSQN